MHQKALFWIVALCLTSVLITQLAENIIGTFQPSIISILFVCNIFNYNLAADAQLLQIFKIRNTFLFKLRAHSIAKTKAQSIQKKNWIEVNVQYSSTTVESAYVDHIGRGILWLNNERLTNNILTGPLTEWRDTSFILCFHALCIQKFKQFIGL